MKRIVRRIARPQPRGPSRWLCGAIVINLLLMLAPAGAEMAPYRLPTHELIRRIERDQALEQQRQHEMARAHFRDARARQMEAALYHMRPVQPALTRCEPVRFAYVHPQRPPGSTGHWRIVSEPSLPPLEPLTPPPTPRPALCPSQKLELQRETLIRQVQRLEMELRRLHQDTERRTHEIEQRIHERHQQIARVNAELERLERERQERQRQLLMEAQRQTEQLSEQARRLQEQTGRIQRTLDAIHRPAPLKPVRPTLEPVEPPRPVQSTLGPVEPPKPVEGQLPRPIKELPPVEPPRHEPPPPMRPEPAPRVRREIERRERMTEDRATREFREKVRQELKDLHEADEYTHRLLKRLLCEDHPSTVGSASQYWR